MIFENALTHTYGPFRAVTSDEPDNKLGDYNYVRLNYSPVEHSDESLSVRAEWVLAGFAIYGRCLHMVYRFEGPRS